jgi:hypothetical protein
VRQILTNLTSNAVKFTEQGHVTFCAGMTAAGLLRFTVADTGIAFDAAQKDRVFGRFQQADGSITRRFVGAGLGLSICRQLADLMGGTLHCDSTLGEGSTFWFEAAFERGAEVAASLEDPADGADRGFRGAGRRRSSDQPGRGAADLGADRRRHRHGVVRGPGGRGGGA